MAGVKGRSGTNKGKDKPWQEALRLELYADDKLKLRLIARACVDAAQAGDMQAIKEIGDRIDGKAIQPTQISGPDDEPLRIEYAWQSQPQLDIPAMTESSES